MMNKRDYVAHLAVEVHTLEIWLEREWIVPAEPATEAKFSDADVARGRLIQDLTARLGVNDEGVDVVLHLLDQLHGMRHAFEDLRAEMKQTK